MSLVRSLGAIGLLLTGTQLFAASCDALIGEWNWFTGGAVTLKDNHTILYDGKPAGNWECTDNGTGAAKLHWSNNFVDSITVSGDTISGINQQGVPISATRKQMRSPTRSAPVAPAEPIQPLQQVKPQQTYNQSAQPIASSPQPQAADPRLAQGWCVIDGNNYQQAIAFLNSVLSKNPRDAEALYYRGRCWHYSNQYRRAIQDLNASVELDPRNSWAYLYRGRALFGMNANKSQIEAEFTRAIQADSNNADAYFARANLYAQAFMTKDLEAYKDLTRVIAFNPRFTQAYVLRAEIVLDHNQTPSALADLDQAKAINPNYPDLDCRYGLAYWIAGQRQLGDQWLGRCYARDPEARPVYEKEKQIRLQAAAHNSQQAAASGCHQGNWRQECTRELGPSPSQSAISSCIMDKWSACGFMGP